MPAVDLRKQRGAHGEALVAQYIEREGFKVIARNYSRRQGEVDLIARRDDMLIFIEVKARTRGLFDLTELVNRTKQRRIIAAAKSFIIEHAYDTLGYRFDVALIENLANGAITYIPDAFTEQYY